MRLKGLIGFEIAAAVIIIVVILLIVEGTPYLATSNPEAKVEVYSQKAFAQGNASLIKGQVSEAWFNYSTFDPAILVIDLKFHNWQTQGRLTIYCNNLKISTFEPSPKNPDITLTTVSVSGFELVKPKVDLISPAPIEGYRYGNKIAFISENENGFEGSFDYQISIRGSR